MQSDRINKLGAEGWRLMHVYPAGHEQDGRCRPNWYTEYLFMRESSAKPEERSIFEQVFGKSVRW